MQNVSPRALVYIARCRSTGKCYVGCTRKTMEARRAEHHVSAMNGSPWAFHKALKQLGLAAFDWSVLERCDSRDMYKLERHWIAKYNSFRAGFNSTEGGAGSASDGRAARRKLPVAPGKRGWSSKPSGYAYARR